MPVSVKPEPSVSFSTGESYTQFLLPLALARAQDNTEALDRMDRQESLETCPKPIRVVSAKTRIDRNVATLPTCESRQQWKRHQTNHVYDLRNCSRNYLPFGRCFNGYPALDFTQPAQTTKSPSSASRRASAVSPKLSLMPFPGLIYFHA